MIRGPGGGPRPIAPIDAARAGGVAAGHDPPLHRLEAAPWPPALLRKETARVTATMTETERPAIYP